jgi:hypothetical protein
MSEKIHVILDTNIFRKNPSLSDLSFQALERLCKAKIAKLHIPYIVEREFQTQQTALYKKDLDTAISSLNSIIRRGLPQDKIIDLTVIKEQLNNISSPILSDVENSIIVWAKSIHAQRHAISQEQAVAAMESYFQGTPPLKNPKNRDDIPDSFIFQTVLSVANNNKPLFVIAEDDKIASAAEKIDGVFVYRNLPAFIESSDIQKEILELDVISNIEEVKQVIKQVELETNELSYLIRVQGGNKIRKKYTLILFLTIIMKQL